MENILMKYMDDRLVHSQNLAQQQPGPVITISRVCGCSANEIAEALVKKVNRMIDEKHSHIEWHAISKEILSVASKEVNIHPEKMLELVEEGRKGFIDEIVYSFTETYYPHIAKVKAVIEDVIHTFAVRGHVVIVGRAGAFIASNIERSLHVSLEAPLSWRVSVIAAKRHLSQSDAQKYVEKMDEQRQSFKRQFQKKHHELPDYDISINCKSHSIDQICEIIIKEAQIRNLISVE